MREVGGFPTIWSFCFGGEDGGWRGWRSGGGGLQGGEGVDRALPHRRPRPPDATPSESPRPRAACGPDRRPSAGGSHHTGVLPRSTRLIIGLHSNCSPHEVISHTPLKYLNAVGKHSASLSLSMSLSLAHTHTGPVSLSPLIGFGCAVCLRTSSCRHYWSPSS